jgi:hypothetical protein
VSNSKFRAGKVAAARGVANGNFFFKNSSYDADTAAKF